jgi:hypothetical protein
MEELEKYYSETAKEIMTLVAFHERFIAGHKKNGIFDPNDEVMAKELISIKELIRKNAAAKLDWSIHDKKYEERMMKERIWVMCETCNLERRVEIIGESRHKQNRWKGDRLKCTVCGSTFFSEFPNNWKDKVDFFRWHIEYFRKLLDDKTIKGKKREEGEALYAASDKSYKDLADAQALVERDDIEREQTRLRFEEQFEKIRDHLLLGKLQVSGKINKNTGQA